MRVIPVAVALALSVAPALWAQSGRLDDRTEYAILTGARMYGHHGPLRVILLWHGPPGWQNPRGRARATADSIMRWARLRADERRAHVFGYSVAFAEENWRSDTLTVEGHVVPLVRTDSALILMVLIPPGDGPRTVTSVRVRTDLVPEEFWSRTWMSGDTTFIVQPRYPRSMELLRTALLTVPEVAAFLR